MVEKLFLKTAFKQLVLSALILIIPIVVSADTKITAFTADTSPTTDDLVVTVNDPGGTPANRKVTLGNLKVGALLANGANCSAGNSPLGVDELGAVESCFDVWTEAENTSAGYTTNTGTVTNIATTFPILGGPITTTGTLTFGGLSTSSPLAAGA